MRTTPLSCILGSGKRWKQYDLSAMYTYARPHYAHDLESHVIRTSALTVRYRTCRVRPCTVIVEEPLDDM